MKSLFAPFLDNNISNTSVIMKGIVHRKKIMFPICMLLLFSVESKKDEYLKNIHAVLFHTMTVHSDDDCQAVILVFFILYVYTIVVF